MGIKRRGFRGIIRDVAGENGSGDRAGRSRPNADRPAVSSCVFIKERVADRKLRAGAFRINRTAPAAAVIVAETAVVNDQSRCAIDLDCTAPMIGGIAFHGNIVQCQIPAADRDCPVAIMEIADRKILQGQCCSGNGHEFYAVAAVKDHLFRSDRAVNREVERTFVVGQFLRKSNDITRICIGLQCAAERNGLIPFQCLGIRIGFFKRCLVVIRIGAACQCVDNKRLHGLLLEAVCCNCTGTEYAVLGSGKTAVSVCIRIKHFCSRAKTVPVGAVGGIERHICTVDLITGVVQIVPVSIFCNHISSVCQLCHQHPSAGCRTGTVECDLTVSIQKNCIFAICADTGRIKHCQQLFFRNDCVIAGKCSGGFEMYIRCNDPLH